MVAAPADTGGRNAAVPPPLRVVHYCPLHFRPWIPNAHKRLQTKIIFAHILQRARPMYGAELGAGGVCPTGDDDAPAGGAAADATTTTVLVVNKKGRKKNGRNRSSIARKLSANTAAKRQRKQSGFISPSSSSRRS